MAARNAELEHQSCSKQERTFMAIRFGNAVSCAKSLMGVVLLILLYAGFGHSQADSGSPDGEPIAPAKTPATPPPPGNAMYGRPLKSPAGMPRTTLFVAGSTKKMGNGPGNESMRVQGLRQILRSSPCPLRDGEISREDLPSSGRVPSLRRPECG